MKPYPKYFEKIRIRPDKDAELKLHAPACQWDGCKEAGTHCERRRLAREVSSRIVRNDDSQVGLAEYGRALIAIAQELQQRLKTRSRRRLRRHVSC